MLLHGVGGGTCQWAAQMARLRGYKVIGTAAKGKADVAKATGCDELILLDEVRRSALVVSLARRSSLVVGTAVARRSSLAVGTALSLVVRTARRSYSSSVVAPRSYSWCSSFVAPRSYSAVARRVVRRGRLDSTRPKSIPSRVGGGSSGVGGRVRMALGGRASPSPSEEGACGQRGVEACERLEEASLPPPPPRPRPVASAVVACRRPRRASAPPRVASWWGSGGTAVARETDRAPARPTVPGEADGVH